MSDDELREIARRIIWRKSGPLMPNATLADRLIATSVIDAGRILKGLTLWEVKKMCELAIRDDMDWQGPKGGK